MRPCAFAALLVCACGPVRGTFEMGITSPIAVGASVFVGPSSSVTVRVGLTQTVHTKREVAIVSSAIEPADAWEKIECATCKGYVEYRALRENSATLTVEANDGAGTETFVKSVEALAPEKVSLFVGPCAQLTFQTGTDFELYLQLLRGTRVLNDHRFPSTSFVVEGGATVSGPPSSLRVNTDAAAGKGRIRTSLDPAFDVPFTVFTPAEVSGIDVVPFSPTDPPLTAGRSKALAVIIAHPGAPACKDRLVRKVGSLTPDTCDTPGGTTATQLQDGGYWMTVRAKAPGTCTISASVEGSPATTTRDFQVFAVDAGSADGG